MTDGPLTGKHIAIGGAGLAGLTAARELERSGAAVTLIEARDRIGGRVHTLRGFPGGHHAEAGADLIEAEQTHVRELAEAVGLKPVRILRQGFGYYGPDRRGRRRIRQRPTTFVEAEKRLRRLVAEFQAANGQWDSPVAAALGRQSVAEWLRTTRAPAEFASGMRGLRGFFLADPEDLSLLALVEQFAEGSPGQEAFYRLPSGNDRLPAALGAKLRARLLLESAVRRVTQRAGDVVVTVSGRNDQSEIRADYFVAAMPASTLREVHFEPPLHADQQRAICTLRYGAATRVVVHFSHRFWRAAGRPRAFGTDLPIGAVWDGNEQQRGPRGILTMLAGGRASGEVRAIIATEGIGGVVRRLTWLGTPSDVLSAKVVPWDDDPWARGGYAYFDPTFDPKLRSWLARPAGRVLFAGEHTSVRWQGYMSGAVESGRRVAAEVRALVALGATSAG